MDKGVGMVLMNERDYIAKLDRIVNDETRFMLLDYDLGTTDIAQCSKAPWVAKATSVKNYCKNYIKQLVDESTYYRIYPTGAQPGKLYGMAKIHKEGCPLRPVLSAINTPEYYLAKWLEQHLKPFVDNTYTVSSSSDFVEELHTLRPSDTDVCVSLDIKSLYTNVPLKEVIDDIAETVYATNAESSFFIDSKITPKVLKNMLKVCSQSIFLYDHKVYKQIDGVAMGSPLAPLLANWFVSKIENTILRQNIDYKPIIYRRYVDDVFALFQSTDQRDTFFSILNGAHPNLIFTMETSTTSLPFLDTAVSIANGKFNTEVYRKTTNTGVVMNFRCMAPSKWKVSLGKCFLTRAYRLSSSYKFFIAEVDRIKTILKNNAYPEDLIGRIVSEFISYNEINSSNFKTTPTEKRQKSSTDNHVYLTIPYLGKPSLRFQHRMKRNLQQYGLEVLSAYSTTKVGEYFNLKTPLSHMFKANIVYKFTCLEDPNISYIGETKRQLFERIWEHRNGKNSAIFDHLYSCTTCQNSPNIVDQFEILKHCTTKTILSAEAIMISKFQPSLNKQLGPSNGMLTSLKIYK
jgi:hypothetical protein